MIFTNYISIVLNKCWTLSLWLPDNITWEDLVDNPKFSNIFYSISYSLIFIFARILIQRFIILPWGIRKGLKTMEKPMINANSLIEKVFQENPTGNLNHMQIKGVAKQLDWNERKVERYLRNRQQQNLPSTLEKLTESGWKCIYLSFIVIYGILMLWNKPWFWDVRECWTNFIHQHFSLDVNVYYLMQLSYLWSDFVFLFVDVRRKGFLEIFLHHCVTLALGYSAYWFNLVRIGTLVFFLHDPSELFLEATKLCKYIKWERGLHVCGATFVLVWIATRIVIYPFYIMRNVWFELPLIISSPFVYQFLRSMMVVLLMLNCLWTYLIFKTLYRNWYLGKMVYVERSASEASDVEKNSN